MEVLEKTKVDIQEKEELALSEFLPHIALLRKKNTAVKVQYVNIRCTDTVTASRGSQVTVVTENRN